MEHRRTGPDLLICQPAILFAAQYEFALGVQNLWFDELMDLDIDCRPTVWSRPDSRDPTRRQPMFHRTPYALSCFRRGGHPELQTDARFVLQSQVSFAIDPLCEGRARLGFPHEDRLVTDSHVVGGIRVLLRWVFEVIDEVSKKVGRSAPGKTWQDVFETNDPYQAAAALIGRGLDVRRVLGLDGILIEDRVAEAERRASVN